MSESIITSFQTPAQIIGDAEYAVVEHGKHAYKRHIALFDMLKDARNYHQSRIFHGEDTDRVELVSIDHHHTCGEGCSCVDAEGDIVDGDASDRDEDKKRLNAAIDTLRYVYELLEEAEASDNDIAAIFYRMRGYATAKGLYEFE